MRKVYQSLKKNAIKRNINGALRGVPAEGVAENKKPKALLVTSAFYLKRGGNFPLHIFLNYLIRRSAKALRAPYRFVKARSLSLT